MALILQREKRVILRVVYVGIPFSGKSSIFKSLYNSFSEEDRGEMRHGFINQDRCLAFDLLKSSISVIPGFTTSIQLLTLPGFVSRSSSYSQILRQVDGVVYVVDSQWDRMVENVSAFSAMKEILVFQKKSLLDVPFVLAFNKRDLKQAAPMVYLEQTFNQRSQIVPSFEVNPMDGIGLRESLQSIISRLESRYV